MIFFLNLMFHYSAFEEAHVVAFGHRHNENFTDFNAGPRALDGQFQFCEITSLIQNSANCCIKNFLALCLWRYCKSNVYGGI